MRIRRALTLALTCALFSALPQAQCAKDYRSDKLAGLILNDLTVAGTTSLSSTQLAEIVNAVIGTCFDDSVTVEEMLRASFQDHGYFQAEVKRVSLKSSDPLAVPKPVTAEADVAEGPQYRVGEITFLKNHAFPSDRLRQEFLLKPGEVFERVKVATGLEGLQRIYGSAGFLDGYCIPDTEFASNATMSLRVTIFEGEQYHFNKLQIIAEKDAADRLEAKWELREGAVYDAQYIDQFIDANHDSLPQGFTTQNVQVIHNCPKALVDIRLIVDPAQDRMKPPPQDIPCEEKDKKRTAE